jgi:hypothetical protein
LTYSPKYSLIAFLFFFIATTPAISEQLEPRWQGARDHFNQMSDQACAGDERAYRELVVSARGGADPVAMTDLAWLYGTKECAFSEGKSKLGRVGLYQQAAEAGYPIAQSNYAEYLIEGELITRKPGLAKEYFHRAIDAGYGNAAVVLGLYYLSAEFLPIDSTKARALFNRADREGADLAELLKLETELNKIEAVGEPVMTEIDGLPELFIGSWGYGYGEARWDYAPKGKFEARVYVGVYDNSKHFYMGMMREANNPVVRLTGVSVEYADESVSSIDLSFCQSDTCRVNQYGDNFGRPGSFITIELPPSKQRGVLEAIKSGSYVVFDYQTQTGPKNYTLSLKGSRKAIETLERKNGLLPESVESAGASPVDTHAYRVALNNVFDELNLVWSPKSGSLQAGQQWIRTTRTPCAFETYVEHPNTGKTTREFNFWDLDPDQILWEEDFFFGKAAFFTVKTLGDREVTKLWTSYPDGTSAFEDTAEIALYIGDNGNFSGIKPQLATAIRACNSLAQQ